MKTKKLQLALFLIGTILFNWFFWHEELGLNLLLFNAFIIASALLIYPKLWKSKTVVTLIFTSITTAFMVFAYGSTVAKITNFMSLLIFIGYVHQPQLKAIFFAGFTAIGNFFHFPIKYVFRGFKENNETQNQVPNFFRKVKLTLLPIVFLFIFYWIFKFANPRFDFLTNQFGLKISTFFQWLFSDISWLRIPFFLLGCIIIAAFIYHDNIVLFVKKEIGLKDIISRTRKPLIKPNIINPHVFTPRMLPLSIGLKNEYRSALILIGTVNLLLMLVNALDVNWLWLNFEYNGDFSLSQFVHEGTYLLILSILLSMGILLYFFRKNINFLPKNKLIKDLSILWIAQNIILVISVGLRNYYYIQYYGLAYKRIGVVVFLLLTLIGLITLFIKITKLKSSFYLLKINSISVFALFVLLSLFNWDVIITHHNLSHLNQQKVDVTFLLTLSDKTLPLIDQNQRILDVDGVRYRGENHRYIFNEKVKRFKAKQKELSWLSMNLSTYNALNYFNTKKTHHENN